MFQDKKANLLIYLKFPKLDQHPFLFDQTFQYVQQCGDWEWYYVCHTLDGLERVIFNSVYFRGRIVS